MKDIIEVISGVFLLIVLSLMLLFSIESDRFCGAPVRNYCSPEEYNGIDNFLEELKIANKTKDLEKLSFLAYQARVCLKDGDIQDAIREQITQYKEELSRWKNW